MYINTDVSQEASNNSNFPTITIKSETADNVRGRDYLSKNISFPDELELSRTTVDSVRFHLEQYDNSPYRKSYIAWDKLERANKPGNYTEKTRYLSKNARALLSVVYQKLKKQPILLLNHKYISTITGAGSRQNRRIIQELKNVIEVSYKRGTTELKGKIYKNCYELKHKVTATSISNLQAVDDSSNISKRTKMSAKITSSTIYRENNILNNRSNESNLKTNNFKEKSTLTLSKQMGDNHIFQEHAANKLVREKKIKKLSDFYPLTPDDCSELQSKSGRKFTLTAMNEILKDMSGRLLSPEFWSKKGFMAYMTKAFTCELRDEVKTTGENFTINANYQKEKYLQEIEYSRQVNPEWHFKKKLACTLTTDTAYNLLKAYKTFYKSGDSFILRLHKKVNLTETEKEIILSQAKAVFEIISFTGERVLFNRLEVKYPISAEQSSCDKQTEIPRTSFTDDIWGKLRRIFIKDKGSDAVHIDRNWLSRLNAIIDNENKTLTLTAPTELFRDRVSQDYFPYLEKAAGAHGFSLRPITTTTSSC